MKIPKIIHYCWFGKGQKNELIKKCINSWKIHLPDYKIIEWNEDNIYETHPYLESCLINKNWSNASNYWRCECLKKFGGIYFDTDVEVFKSFNSLLDDKCFLGFQVSGLDHLNKLSSLGLDADKELVNGAIIGAQRNHRFINLLKEYVINHFDGTENSNLSGPFSTSEVLKSIGLDLFDTSSLGEGVKIYSNKFFYPTPWWEREFDAKKDLYKETFCVHHWTHLW
jgi:hypothetical protein